MNYLCALKDHFDGPVWEPYSRVGAALAATAHVESLIEEGALDTVETDVVVLVRLADDPAAVPEEWNVEIRWEFQCIATRANR